MNKINLQNLYECFDNAVCLAPYKNGCFVELYKPVCINYLEVSLGLRLSFNIKSSSRRKILKEMALQSKCGKVSKPNNDAPVTRFQSQKSPIKMLSCK